MIRTDTLAEMFDVTTLLANQAPPRGDRVATVTNAGGLGILSARTPVRRTADDPGARSGDRRGAPPIPASAGVDREPGRHDRLGRGDDYERTLAAVAEDPGVDLAIRVYIPPLEQGSDEVAGGIVRALDGSMGASRCSPASCPAGDCRRRSERGGRRSRRSRSPSRLHRRRPCGRVRTMAHAAARRRAGVP